MRKLASVRVIDDLTPIEGADRIEVARLDGWNVIVQKGLYSIGDKVVYFEIDSLLPIRDEYEFLRDRCYVKSPEGFRIKTMKMRGVVSQGLVMPYDGDEPVGTDLTETLGVALYEKPLPVNTNTNIVNNWPWFIHKTDQERVQNITVPRIPYEVTLKYDGSSCTVYRRGDHIGICSRNYEIDKSGPYWEAAQSVVEALEAYGMDYAVQGELMGPGVQGNPMGFNRYHFFVFDIWDIERQQYLTPDERYNLLDTWQDFALIEEAQVLYEEWTPAEVYDSEQHLRDDILAMADLTTAGGKPIEGIVFKALDGSFSFKAINNKYLLKEK